MEGHAEVVRTLLLAGANPNVAERATGSFPLHPAVKEGHVTTVAALIDGGADVNVVEVDGQTPLYIAAEEGSGEIVRLLVAAGARNFAWFWCIGGSQKSEGAGTG